MTNTGIHVAGSTTLLNRQSEWTPTYHFTWKAREWKKLLTVNPTDTKEQVNKKLTKVLNQVFVSYRQKLKGEVEGLKCKGEFGCPRCGNLGVCGSLVNEVLDSVIKLLGGVNDFN